MDIKDLLGMLLVGLFLVAFITFGVNMGQEHDADINIDNNSIINDLSVDTSETIGIDDTDDNLGLTANATLSGFNEEDVTGTASDGIFFSVVTSVGKTLMGWANAVFNVIWDPLLKLVLPGDGAREVRQAISIVLSAILSITLALLAWKLYRTGQ